MSAQQMVRCGDCTYFVRDGKCRFLETPEGRAKDRPFAYAPFWVWSDCYSDKEQVRSGVQSMGRWEQALTRPIPVPGVIGDERMEGLYRRTEGLRARATALEAALRELVAVKALKDKAERGVTVRGDAEARGMCSSFQEQSSVLAEYARRKPLAWEAAQKVLAAIDAARAALDEGERG